MREMKILLVGLGGMGKVHFANIALIPCAKIVAAVGKGEGDEKTAKELNLPFYNTITEAIEMHDEINLVDITTPTFMHKENALEAIKLNRDVLVEKPLALSSEAASMLFKEAKKRNVSLNVAHVMRYTHEFKALKELIANKKYGAILDAEFTRLSEKPKWVAGSWLFDKEKSGLVPFDLHIHDLDMIVSLFGIPNDMKYFEINKDENFYYFIQYVYSKADITVKAEAGWLNAKIPFTATWRVIFEKAVVTYDGKEVKVYPNNGDVYTIDTHYDVVVSTGINVPPTGWYFEELKTILSQLAISSSNLISEEEIVAELKILEDLKE